MKVIKTQYPFLIASLVFFVLGTMYYTNALDINFHDTYFIISLPLLSYYPAMYMLVTFFIYYVFNKALKPLNNMWGIIHFMLTLLSSIIICKTALGAYQPQRYYSFSNQSSFVTSHIMLIIAVIIFLLAQLIFLVNIIKSLTNNKVSKL
jgi:heme/copper-type cytochrome/quinol oxidase subunit 1